MIKHILIKKNIEIYDFKYYVIFDKETYKRYTGEEVDCLGCCWNDQKNYVLYIDFEIESESLIYQTITHESYHMSDWIFDNKGIQYKKESGNEHMAYLLDFIYKQVSEAFTDYKKYISSLNK